MDSNNYLHTKTSIENEVIYLITDACYDTEIEVCDNIIQYYDKIVQEGDVLDEVKRMNEGKSLLNKIVFSLYRLIVAIINKLTGKLEKSKNVIQSTRATINNAMTQLPKQKKNLTHGLVIAGTAIVSVAGGFLIGSKVKSNKNETKTEKSEEEIKDISIDKTISEKDLAHKYDLVYLTESNDVQVVSVLNYEQLIEQIKNITKTVSSIEITNDVDHSAISRLIQENSELKNNLDAIKNKDSMNNDEDSESVKTYKQQYNAAVKTQETLQKELETLKSKLDLISNNIKQRNETIKNHDTGKTNDEQFVDDLTKLNKELQNLLSMSDTILTYTINNQTNLKNVSDDLVQFKSQYDDQVKLYVPVLEALYKVSSMKRYIDDKNLAKEYSYTPDCILPFVEVAGNRYSLGWDIVDYVKRYKKEHRESMTQEEKNLYDKVNSFYAARDKNERKILMFPEDLPGYKGSDAFIKLYYQDIDTPTKTFRKYADVYVPGLCEHKQEKIVLSTKVIVRGR
jgi:DNA repair exonuclease SbcCD ATPase subunit